MIKENIEDISFGKIVSIVDSLEDEKRNWIPLKIAFLRNITIDPIFPYLKFLCFQESFKAYIYMGEYDNAMQDILSTKSPLYKHQPEVIVLVLKLENLLPQLTQCFAILRADEVERESNRILDYMEQAIKAITTNSKSLILLHNFEIHVYPSFGILDYQYHSKQVNTLRGMNMRLLDMVNKYENTFIVDIDLLQATIGYNGFIDNRYWHIGKAPYTREALKTIAQEYIKFIKALKGKNKKCLVLDCDDTLWGGIVGEDGMENIKIGRDYPGSAYWEFQQAVLNLYNRGIILAICSKNNERDVLEVLEKHPDMALRKKHFACMRINWKDKVANLKEISQELNIGLDSLVLIDDSEFEASMVKNYLPEVEVITLPKDPTIYRDLLNSCGLFDTLTFSEEDRMRGQMYKAEAQRQRLQFQVTDLEDYYRYLKMEIIIGRADSFSIPRIAQLTQKTNQYNLTTTRYSEAHIKEFASSLDHNVLYLRLKDRFGDSGIVGVVILEHSGVQSTVDTFLLSCRVIGRGLEDVFLKECLEVSRKRGQKLLKGIYIRTKKNSQVSDFYQKRGFKAEIQTDSRSEYIFALNNAFPDFPTHFKSVDSETNRD